MASMRCDMDYNLSTFISTLNIKSTKPLDAASYRVLAENIAGKAETSCKLFIESVPNIDETAYVNPDSFRSLEFIPKPNLSYDSEDGDKKPSTKKPKKSKKPPTEEPEDGEKSVAVPGNGSDMTVQTDVQAILTQNNVLIANLIGEVQKLNALMTQYLAAEEVEDQRDEDESGAPEDGGDGESAEAPEEAPATGGKISDADEAASKLVEMKLAEIKAVLERVKKTGPK
jgi:hypothetical protein